MCRGLLKLKGIALSGEGEATLCERFEEVVAEILNIRDNTSGRISKWCSSQRNGSGTADVQRGLRLFRATDEIWIKLDAELTKPCTGSINAACL